MRSVLRRLRVSLLAIVVFAIAYRLRHVRRRPIPPCPKVLLIGAYGNGNFGDDIIGQAITSAIRGLGGSTHIAARQSDVTRLRTDIAPTSVVGEGIWSLFRTLRLARGRCDVAILGGGGLLEGRSTDVNVQRLVLEYLGKVGVAGLDGTPIAIHGVGVSPVLFTSRLVTMAAKAMLRSVATISVRDIASADVLRSVGVEAALIRDPASALFGEWARLASPNPELVGVVMLDHHRWPSFTPADVKTERVRTAHLERLARHLSKQAAGGMRIRLFAFHWSDVPITEDLRLAFVACGGPPESLEVVQYSAEHSNVPFLELMKCGTVLTMRFHPALAALMAGARVEIVGKLQKLESLRGPNTGESGWSYPREYGDPISQLNRAIGLGQVDDECPLAG